MVGERRNSRLVPLTTVVFKVSNVRSTLSSVGITALNRFSPVTGWTPSNLALPPETKKARMPALTFWMTCAWQLGVWLKFRTPPRPYPPAVRCSVPPVRFGRSDDAKGATPRWRMPLATLVVEKVGRS